MTITELRARLAEARARLVPVADEVRSLADQKTLTEGQQEHWSRRVREAEKLNDEIRQLDTELRDAIEDAVRTRRLDVEPGEGASRMEGPTLLRRGGDPWTERTRYDSPDEIRSRALRIVEHGDTEVNRGALDDVAPVTPDQRATLETLVRNDDRFADYTIAVSRPSYQSAFRSALRSQRDLWDDEERAAVREVTRLAYLDGETRASLAEGNTGALMLPFYLDPTIVLTNVGAENPFRLIARVEQVTTNAWHGVTSAGVTAEWTAESAQVADATPTMVQPTITPVRGDAHVQVTMEQLQDSNVDTQVPTLLADAKNRLEATAFAIGTGSTQPTGVVTTVGGTTASRVASVTTAAYGAVDVFNVDNALQARYRPNAAWIGHWAVYNATRQFTTGASPSATAFWANLGDGRPEQLVGHNVYESSAMTNSVTTTGAQVLVLGDFKQGFAIIDRVGMSILVNPYVVGAQGRPIGETGFTGFFRTGSGVINADAFRMLQLK